MSRRRPPKDPLRSASKFLSLILRHDPSAAGVTLDAHGWIAVDELLAGMAAVGTTLTVSDLERIVTSDAKGRYALVDGRIRANQGHSLDVDLGLAPLEPPPVLFHGTARRFLDAILRDGLASQSRQHVHLSADRTTAVAVGSRHGQPVVLVVDARRMAADGLAFFRSENGVWLTDAVPPPYLSLDAAVAEQRDD